MIGYCFILPQINHFSNEISKDCAQNNADNQPAVESHEKQHINCGHGEGEEEKHAANEDVLHGFLAAGLFFIRIHQLCVTTFFL